MYARPARARELIVCGVVAVLTACASAAAAGIPAVSALTKGPVVANPSIPLRQAMADNASQFNLGLTAVYRSTHLLGSPSGVQVYGIEQYGTICFFLYNGLPGPHIWATGQTCGGLTSPRSAVWQQVPGTCQKNPFVVGVVSDQARAVTVSIDSQTTTVRPVHNIFIVPYKGPQCSPTGEQQAQQDILPATVSVDGRVSPSTGSWPSP